MYVYPPVKEYTKKQYDSIKKGGRRAVAAIRFGVQQRQTHRRGQQILRQVY
jgi:hypothetical protein